MNTTFESPTAASATFGDFGELDLLAARRWVFDGQMPLEADSQRIEDVVEQVYGLQAAFDLHDRAVAALDHCGA